MPITKLREEIQIHKDVQVDIENKKINVSGPKGELSRLLDLRGIRFKKKEDKIIIESDSTRRKCRAALGTSKSHLENMIHAVTEGFSYKLKIVYSHFPISVKVKEDRVEIHNFIGEQKPRTAEILGDTEVEVNGDEVIVKGTGKEEVGQTAANIEQVSQVRSRDPRVFQDGIYIIERP